MQGAEPLLQVLPEGGAGGCCGQSGVRALNNALKVLLEGAVELACWWWCKGGA